MRNVKIVLLFVVLTLYAQGIDTIGLEKYEPKVIIETGGCKYFYKGNGISYEEYIRGKENLRIGRFEQDQTSEACPAGIAVDDKGNIFILDLYKRRIQKYSQSLKKWEAIDLKVKDSKKIVKDKNGNWYLTLGNVDFFTIDKSGNFYIINSKNIFATDKKVFLKFNEKGELIGEDIILKEKIFPFIPMPIEIKYFSNYTTVFIKNSEDTSEKVLNIPWGFPDGWREIWSYLYVDSERNKYFNVLMRKDVDKEVLFKSSPYNKLIAFLEVSLPRSSGFSFWTVGFDENIYFMYYTLKGVPIRVDKIYPGAIETLPSIDELKVIKFIKMER